MTCWTRLFLFLMALHVVVEDLPHSVIDERDSERATINRRYTSISELRMGHRIADCKYGLFRLLGCEACLWNPSLPELNRRAWPDFVGSSFRLL